MSFGGDEMKKVLPYVVIYLFGGGLYCFLEVCFRGFTHPTMAAVGGFCVTAIYLLDMLPISIVKKMLLCGLVITAVEGVSGAVLNLALGMNVWDYSGYALNLGGQVCLLYFIFWVFLSYPALLFCRMFRRWIFT